MHLPAGKPSPKSESDVQETLAAKLNEEGKLTITGADIHE
jgi:hypothetical protein